MQEQTELSPSIVEFQQKTRQALLEVIKDPQNDDLLQRFRFTYEERGKQPWLAESGQHRVSGLTHALCEVLFELNYNSPSQQWLAEENRQADMLLPTDDNFRKNLVDAINEVIHHPSCFIGFNDFASSLRGRNVILENLGLDEVKELIINGSIVIGKIPMLTAILVILGNSTFPLPAF